ncbi:MAG: phage head-tail connector protein [Rhodobacteraceae bacterium]|nr:phage head-tail connector protein [Paracoccaceae bacterium]
MTSVLIDPPTIEPVSVADMRAYLRVSGTQEEELLGDLVKAARQHVERETRRALISQNWRLYLENWPFGRVIVLPVAPILSVSEVAVYDLDGDRHLLSSDDYQLDKARSPARLRVRPGAGLPLQNLNGIEVDFTAGYGPTESDVPENLRQSIRMLAAHWFEHREAVAEDALEPVPFGVDRLLSTHRVPLL